MTNEYVRAGEVKWIAKGADVGVQERTLSVGQEIPWHYHTIITDTMVCLDGVVQIELLDPKERISLTTGSAYSIAVSRPHRITAQGEKPCRFLLIQGVGRYDRHPVNPDNWSGNPG